MFRKHRKKRPRSSDSDSGTDRGTPSPNSQTESLLPFVRPPVSPPIDIKYTYEQRDEKNVFIWAKEMNEEGERKDRKVQSRVTSHDFRKYDLRNFRTDDKYPGFGIQNFGNVPGNAPKILPLRPTMIHEKKIIGEEKQIIGKGKQLIENKQKQIVTDESKQKNERTGLQIVFHDATKIDEHEKVSKVVETTTEDGGLWDNWTLMLNKGDKKKANIDKNTGKRAPQTIETTVSSSSKNASVNKEMKLKPTEAIGFKNVIDDDLVVFGPEGKPLIVRKEGRDERLVQTSPKRNPTPVKSPRVCEDTLREKTQFLKANLPAKELTLEKQAILLKIREEDLKRYSMTGAIPKRLGSPSTESKQKTKVAENLKPSCSKTTHFLQSVEPESEKTQKKSSTDAQELLIGIQSGMLTDVEKMVDASMFKTSPRKIREFLEAIQSDSETVSIPQENMESESKRELKRCSTVTTDFLKGQPEKTEQFPYTLEPLPLSSDEEIKKYTRAGSEMLEFPKRIMDSSTESEEEYKDSVLGLKKGIAREGKFLKKPKMVETTKFLGALELQNELSPSQTEELSLQRNVQTESKKELKRCSTVTTNFLKGQPEKTEPSFHIPPSSDEEINTQELLRLARRIGEPWSEPKMGPEYSVSTFERDAQSTGELRKKEKSDNYQVMKKSRKKLEFSLSHEKEPNKEVTNVGTQTEIPYPEPTIKNSWNDITYLTRNVVPFYVPNKITVGTQVSDEDFVGKEEKEK